MNVDKFIKLSIRKAVKEAKQYLNDSKIKELRAAGGRHILKKQNSHGINVYSWIDRDRQVATIRLISGAVGMEICFLYTQEGWNSPEVGYGLIDRKTKRVQSWCIVSSNSTNCIKDFLVNVENR